MRVIRPSGWHAVCIWAVCAAAPHPSPSEGEGEKPPAIVNHLRSSTNLSRPHPFCMRRGAQGVGWQLHRRVQLLRALTHRVCLNGEPLARSELHGAAHARALAGCPLEFRLSEIQRDAGSRGRLALVTFIGGAMKVTAPPGAHPGICAKRRSAEQWAQKLTATCPLHQAQNATKCPTRHLTASQPPVFLNRV